MVLLSKLPSTMITMVTMVDGNLDKSTMVTMVHFCKGYTMQQCHCDNVYDPVYIVLEQQSESLPLFHLSLISLGSLCTEVNPHSW